MDKIKDKMNDKKVDDSTLHVYYTPSVISELVFLLAVVLLCGTAIYMHDTTLEAVKGHMKGQNLRGGYGGY